MGKKKNVIARLLVWIFKAIWYVVKGVFLALWWVLKTLASSVASLFKRKSSNDVAAPANAPASDAATTTPAVKGKKNHKPVETPLIAHSVKSGAFADFSSRLATASTIALIVGKRGSGKSTLGFRILENVHATTKRPCFVLGVRADVLPSWITSVASVDQVSNNGLVLVDEGALTFSSRDSMNAKNKELGKLLAIARHKDLTLLLITQNTGMIDKNVLNLCDTVMVKEGSLLQQNMERDVMKDIYAKAAATIGEMPKEERFSHTYIVDSDFEGVVQYALPSFWNASISKNQA